LPKAKKKKKYVYPFHVIIIFLGKTREVRKRKSCSWSADKKRSSRFGSTEAVKKRCN